MTVNMINYCDQILPVSLKINRIYKLMLPFCACMFHQTGPIVNLLQHLWNSNLIINLSKILLGDVFDDVVRRKCLGLSVRRRFGGSTPSRSVVDDVGVGGVVSTVGGDVENVGIRKNLPSVGISVGSSSGSRISRLTSWNNR